MKRNEKSCYEYSVSEKQEYDESLHNWTITPMIETSNGKGLVLSSQGAHVIVKKDVGSTKQRWSLNKKLSNPSKSRVIILILKSRYYLYIDY